jgi:hypothetical protein
MAGDSDSPCFDLTCSDPAWLQSLEAELTECQGRPTDGFSLHAASLLFSVFYLFWHKHG